MNHIQVILFVGGNENVKVNIPFDLYQQVCDNLKDEESRERLTWDFKNVIMQNFPILHKYIVDSLHSKGFGLYSENPLYGLATDWFDPKEEVYIIGYRVVRPKDKELNNKIVSLGKRIFPDMLTAEELYSFTEGGKGFVEVVIADNQFAGFAQILHYYDVSFVNMMAIAPEWQNKGIGTRFLQHIEKARPQLFVNAPKDLKGCIKRKRFYERNGYKYTPIKMSIGSRGDYDVYVKGDLAMETGVAVIEKVSKMWQKLELKREIG